MRTAHGVRHASSPADGGRVLVAWNHEDVSQLEIVDLGGHGWRHEFMPATSAKPEHIKVVAPHVSAESAAFLVFKDFAYEGDIDLMSVHGCFDMKNPQVIYQVAVSHGEWDDAYAGARWNLPVGGMSGVVNSGSADKMVAPGVYSCGEYDLGRFIVDTRSTFRGSLMGHGLGCIQHYGFIPSAHPTRNMRTMGMGFKLASPAGQHIEIYDMVMSLGSRS